jgi:hypothetical protein
MTLSTSPLDRQVGADGGTWLDREFAADTSSHPRRRLRARFAECAYPAPSMADRAGARPREPDRVIYRGNRLRRRELARVGAQLSTELALPRANPGEQSEGIYRRCSTSPARVTRSSRRARDFMPASWRPALKFNAEQEVPSHHSGDADCCHGSSATSGAAAVR